MISPAPPCKHHPLIRGRGAKPELLGTKEDERTGRPCVPRPGVPMSCGHRRKASGTLCLVEWGLLNCWPLKNPGKGR